MSRGLLRPRCLDFSGNISYNRQSIITVFGENYEKDEKNQLLSSCGTVDAVPCRVQGIGAF